MARLLKEIWVAVMEQDIVERLIDLVCLRFHPDSSEGSAMCDAADEIERLRDDLHAAIQEVADESDSRMAKLQSENKWLRALLLAESRVGYLEALITEWADATDERDEMPGVAYTDRYIKTIVALRNAVGR